MRRPSLTPLLTLAAAATLFACKARTDGSGLRAGEGDGATPARGEFAKVRELVETNGVKTIDALLPLLPEDLLGRYVLLKDSRSTQDASSKAPRVLLYNADATFVMTFNGDKSQAGYDRLETYEFDAATARFNFREIEFPQDSGNTGEVHFTEVNPGACTGCHKNRPRPIYDQWPQWPDAFFGADTVDGEIESSPLESTEFKAFRDDAARGGRYGNLKNLDKYDSRERSERGEPSNSFNKLVLALIEKMIAAEIKTHPKYDQYKYAFEAAIAGCEDIPSFLTAGQKSSFSLAFNAIRQDTVVRNPKASPSVIALRWLFENHGLKTIHWSPTFQPKYRFIRDKTGDGLKLPRSFPELSCAELKEKSLALAPPP